MEMDQIPPAKPPKKEDDATDLDPIKIEGYDGTDNEEALPDQIDRQEGYRHGTWISARDETGEQGAPAPVFRGSVVPLLSHLPGTR